MTNDPSTNDQHDPLSSPLRWLIDMLSSKRWLPFVLLGAALVLWAALFAAGSYLDISADRPRYDLRKPLIILACMATFLGLWTLAIWLRFGRNCSNR